jgi:hypothetical protein
LAQGTQGDRSRRGPGAQGTDVRYIVTNLPGRAKHLYEKVYCPRGNMENLIKEHKLYTKSDRTSCHRWCYR